MARRPRAAGTPREAKSDGDRFRELYRREGLSPGLVRRFRSLVRRHYRDRGRDFPWRRTSDPYRILVSEFMLQQTQVERVRGKYEEFTARFPDFSSLAAADLGEVLLLWQGLGYNRRAKALRETAVRVVAEWGGRLPDDPDELLALPGIGPATAGAVAAFAFNRPAVILETNIRRVFLHFFFPGKEGVKDGDLLPLVERTVDRANPREWYYALMDYGAAMRNFRGNPNRSSAHYRMQPPFEGSNRQVRSALLKALLKESPLDEEKLLRRVGVEKERGRKIVEGLVREGFLLRRGRRLNIP